MKNSNIRTSAILAITLLGFSALAIAATPAKPAEAPKTDTMHSDTMKPADSMMAKGVYQTYTKAAFDAAKGKQRVLFFSATWCKAANADITSNIAKIPAGAVVFKTDYDSEVALKRQYGVTYQHTFVLVDASGKALKKWAGGGAAEIVANLKPDSMKPDTMKK
jgi:thioredoxin 1